MGKRGPAKLPTSLKLLRGESRPSRLNRDSPKPGGGKPTMPRGMTPRAQTVWRRQLKAMGPTGVLTTVDADSLRVYCEAVDRYERGAQLLAESGPLAIGQRGTSVRNPLAQVVRDDAQLIRQYAQALGFLPSAREGLHAGGDDEHDPLRQWIDGTDERP
jgi:P27 family predicted phage terminase small subunit